MLMKLRKIPGIACFAVIAALACASPAQAVDEFCVTNEGQFILAWGAATVSTSEPILIKLAEGTYDLALTPVGTYPQTTKAARPVTIRGGYNSNCTSSSEDPNGTTLTSSRELMTRHVEFRTDGGQTGDLTLERLRVFNLTHFDTRNETETSPERELRISRVVFDQVRSIFLLSATDVMIDNSVFWRGGNVASNAFDFNSCGLDIDNVSSILERLVIRNSTFVANTGHGGLCVGGTVQFDSNNWSVSLTNNIFRDNDSTDIRLTKVIEQPNIPATIRNNIYATLVANRPLSSTPVASLDVDPLFVNAAAGNFRLLGSSLAINSGLPDINLLDERDFEGNPRWFGAAPDRGAFESNIGSTGTLLNVTNTNDTGAGSLRQALIDANASPNLNIIRFNIPGSCPQTITPASLLPTITGPVLIDAYTQPGSARNTASAGWNPILCVVLDGANQLTGVYGFNVDTSALPQATVAIEGMAFSGHAIAAMQFVGGRSHRFVGNQIGGFVGSNLLPSGTGVRVGGSVEGARIGGPDPDERNVIVEALGIGVNVSGSGSIQPSLGVVENNYIGTQSGGDIRGNQRGVFIAGPNHLLQNNVIVNSISHGVELSGATAEGNRVINNRIGLPALCLGTCVDRGNAGHGVLLQNGASDNRIDSNQIAYNEFDGITVTNARRNSLRRNTLYNNLGIGIDLGDDGRDFSNTTDTGAQPLLAGNGSQNHPVLTSVAGTPASGLVTGSLGSANGWYRIDFYGVPDGCQLVLNPLPGAFWGEGRDWVGSTAVQISNGTALDDGTATFSDIPISLSNSANYFVAGTGVTATATRLSGQPSLLNGATHLGTSEFGRCRQYTAASLGEAIFTDGFED